MNQNLGKTNSEQCLSKEHKRSDLELLFERMVKEMSLLNLNITDVYQSVNTLKPFYVEDSKPQCEPEYRNSGGAIGELEIHIETLERYNVTMRAIAQHLEQITGK